MNQYLFLFPVKEYFEFSLKSCRSFELEGHKASELVGTINARYRNQGYGINWLHFSLDNYSSRPCLDHVPDFMQIPESDGNLVAGIPFSRHTKEKAYADPDYVLNQLPPHSRLVLGGFHQWDCVDKIAQRSCERGTDTFVDEDTTEMFFGRATFVGIPLIRNSWSLRELGIMYDLIEENRVLRKEKPWFVQE